MWKLISIEMAYIFAASMFVIFAALAHAFNALLKSREAGAEFTKTDFFILAFLATFSGMFFGLITFAFLTQNIIMVTLFSGLGAFTGIVGLNRITNIALDFFSGMIEVLIKKTGK